MCRFKIVSGGGPVFVVVEMKSITDTHTRLDLPLSHSEDKHLIGCDSKRVSLITHRSHE
jgi:hypothetical protein